LKFGGRSKLGIPAFGLIIEQDKKLYTTQKGKGHRRRS